MSKRLGLILITSLLLGGCASWFADSPEIETVQTEPTIALEPALNSVPESGLGPQQLLAGECGLFLWSQTDITKFIFFSKAQSGQARFAQAETPITLTQIQAGGDIFGQFTTRMGYRADDGRDVSLTFAPGEALEGGQRIERGMISLTDQDGWQTKLPVLGVRACQPEE
ncbi:MAG: hypothetical protein AAGB16_04950 [Pseudomonadota bacterium]